MRRWIGLLGLVLGLAWIMPTYAAAPATITRNTATADFGKEVRFELEAQAPQTVSEVTLLYTIAGGSQDVVTFVEAEPEWDKGGSDVSASFTRDLGVEYLPVGVTLLYKWSIRQDDGTVTETEVQSIKYEDTRFNWKEKTEGGVTVRWYEGDDEWGQAILDSATGGLRRLEERIGSKLTDPIEIMIYADTSDMRGALPPNSEDWIGGQARPDLGWVIGAIDEGNDDELARLVPHELSHLLLHQATKNSYGGMPVWFDEGLAVANQDIPDFGFTERVENAAINGELIPLQALASNFPNDPDKALLSYAQSESVVRYIEATYGVESIAGLVSEFKAGTTDDQAIQTVLGISIEQLDADWRATLPAAQRTPEIEADQQTAPADRFTDSPRQRTNQPGGTTGGTSLFDRLPIWLWVIGGVGALFLILGFTYLIRQSRQPRRF